MGHPLTRLTGRGLLEHAADLLERKALRFGDKEVGEDHTSSTSRSPDEEDITLEISVLRINHVWRDETDDKFPEPVGYYHELALTTAM